MRTSFLYPFQLVSSILLRPYNNLSGWIGLLFLCFTSFLVIFFLFGLSNAYRIFLDDMRGVYPGLFSKGKVVQERLDNLPETVVVAREYFCRKIMVEVDLEQKGEWVSVFTGVRSVDFKLPEAFTPISHFVVLFEELYYRRQ